LGLRNAAFAASLSLRRGITLSASRRLARGRRGACRMLSSSGSVTALMNSAPASAALLGAGVEGEAGSAGAVRDGVALALLLVAAVGGDAGPAVVAVGESQVVPSSDASAVASGSVGARPQPGTSVATASSAPGAESRSGAGSRMPGTSSSAWAGHCQACHRKRRPPSPRAPRHVHDTKREEPGAGVCRRRDLP
jgi:hypothetical protein